MGAIILFEKSERVLASLAVSPVKPGEYLAAKLGSLAILACLVAVVIATGGGLPVRYLLFVPGLILTSGLFSAVGLTIAARSTSLNRFILATIPAELLINIPAILYLFVWRSPWLLFHPGVCLIELSRDGAYAWPALLILLLWLIPAWLLTRRAVCRMFLTLEGIRL
jgi:fluoroquinolone transport system permease protein